MIGKESKLAPNIKLWPEKEVEDGAILTRSLVWEDKWLKDLFTDSRITGLSNIEMNPEFGAKIGASFGALAGKGKTILMSRDSVNVHVEYRRAKDVYEDVLSNVVDLGLVAYPTKAQGLDIVPLHKEPLVLICHPEHPLAKLKNVRLRSLAGQNFVHFSAAVPTRKAVDRALRERRVQVVSVMEFDNIETVKRAVEIDAGVSIVPEVTVRQEVSTGTLVAVPLEDKGLERPLAVVCKRRKTLSPAMKEFIAVLKQPL